MKRYAIILSGGIGSRMGGDIPKQYLEVEGKPIISYVLDTFFLDDYIDGIIIGVADEWYAFVEGLVSHYSSNIPVIYAKPGETRQLSILNALLVAEKFGCKEDDLILIHDAARPLVTRELIHKCYDGCSKADGILPVIPIKDTLYFSSDGKVIQSLLNRNQIWAGQAPEAFIFGKYLNANITTSRDNLLKINGSTEIAFKTGLHCEIVKGDPMNFKITTPEDLSNFKTIIKNESI